MVQALVKENEELKTVQDDDSSKEEPKKKGRKPVKKAESLEEQPITEGFGV